MKRRDFLKFMGVFPVVFLARRLPWQGTELPVIEEPEDQGLQPVEDWDGDDEELCFETQACLSCASSYKPRGYPHKTKLSRRIRHAWEELKWKVHNRLYGEDYWDDDY